MKNPLYVVKGNTVQQAHGLWDLFVKKFNLGPVLKIVMQLVHLLLGMVKDYPTFVVIKKTVDELFSNSHSLKRKFFHRASSN